MFRYLKNRLYRWSGVILCCAVTCYFIGHLIHGNHGLRAWQRLEETMGITQIHLEQLENNHHALGHRVELMRPERMSLDLLTEQSKKILGYVDPEEIVIFRKSMLQEQSHGS
jgi:cell division protein FtsB